MKRVLLLLLVLIPVLASAQPVKSSGLIYYDSIPNTKPAMPHGSEVAYSRDLGKFFRFNLVADDWEEMNANNVANASDSTSFVVYKASHGYNLASYTAEIIAVKADYTLAYATTAANTQVAYVVGTPHSDSIEIQFSGLLHRPDHGLPLGKEYFLTDMPAGESDTIPGTVESRTYIVVDSNYLYLSEVGITQDYTIPVVNIPAVYITGNGGDPVAPHDTVIQKIAELFAEVGRIRPGSYLITNNTTISDNATYQAAPEAPTTPSAGWVWNGEFVTRIKELVADVDLQDTLYGGLGTSVLTPLVPAGSEPTTAEVATWYQNNFETNGLQLANGAKVYWVGNGTQSEPDLIWEVQDDLSHEGGTQWERIVKRVRTPDAEQVIGQIEYTSDELVTNSSFNSGSTGWTGSDPFYVFGDGKVSFHNYDYGKLRTIIDDSELSSGDWLLLAVNYSGYEGQIDVTLDDFSSVLDSYYSENTPGPKTDYLIMQYDGSANVLDIYISPFVTDSVSIYEVSLRRFDGYSLWGESDYITDVRAVSGSTLLQEKVSAVYGFYRTTKNASNTNTLYFDASGQNSDMRNGPNGAGQRRTQLYHRGFNYQVVNTLNVGGGNSESRIDLRGEYAQVRSFQGTDTPDGLADFRLYPGKYTLYGYKEMIENTDYKHFMRGYDSDEFTDDYLLGGVFESGTTTFNPSTSDQSWVRLSIGTDDPFYQTFTGYGGQSVYQTFENGITATRSDSSMVFRGNNGADEVTHLAMKMPFGATSHTLRPYDRYALPNTTPAQTNGAKSTIEFTGIGSATTPAFLRQSRGTAIITGDGDGEQTIVVTFLASMPDTSYGIQLTPEISSGSPTGAELTAHVISSKTTGGFTISLGEAIETGEVVLIHWTVIDQ